MTDLLLQENGYLVLRFLAQDVGRELDTAESLCARYSGANSPGMSRAPCKTRMMVTASCDASKKIT